MARSAIDLPSDVLDLFRQNTSLLTNLQRGIEKESLRVTEEGELSSRQHPEALGSALTHPYITTDFSEAQVELITDVHDSTASCLEQLETVHRFVYQHLDDELLWTTSMPCVLGRDDEIPVGQYGTSNIATAKTVYRRGLGNRYGRLMQTISGIHYNFSLPGKFWQAWAQARGETASQDFQTSAYFGLIRNFRRYSWLLIYLFGASPAVCKSFVKDLPNKLEVFGEGTLYLPYATSLRMGRLGYQSDAQSSLHISYNSLEEYAASMQEALTQSYPPYEDIGVEVDGHYRQLNTALLQIENEFYGTIRPKRPIHSGERPLTALRERGVEYVEVRCLDLNPFLPVGIDAPQARFIDVFLVYCLLAASPQDSRSESEMLGRNQIAVVEEGRKPGLELSTIDGNQSLQDWANALLDAMKPLADLLDLAQPGDYHLETWEEQRRKVLDPALTPSAHVLDCMQRQQIPFFRFAMNQSIAHKGYFDEHRLRGQKLAEYQTLTEDSQNRRQQIEEADTVDFATFLDSYLAFK